MFKVRNILNYCALELHLCKKILVGFSPEMKQEVKPEVIASKQIFFLTITIPFYSSGTVPGHKTDTARNGSSHSWLAVANVMPEFERDQLERDLEMLLCFTT